MSHTLQFFIIYRLKQAVLHLQHCQPIFKSISFPDWLNWAVCLRWPYYALKKTVKDLEESEALTPQWYIVFIVYLTMSYIHNEKCFLRIYVFYFLFSL